MTMCALGCLAPFILALLGALIGHFAGGVGGLPWGLGIGFVAGGAVASLAWVVMKRASDDE